MSKSIKRKATKKSKLRTLKKGGTRKLRKLRKTRKGSNRKGGGPHADAIYVEYVVPLEKLLIQIEDRGTNNSELVLSMDAALDKAHKAIETEEIRNKNKWRVPSFNKTPGIDKVKLIVNQLEDEYNSLKNELPVMGKRMPSDIKLTNPSQMPSFNLPSPPTTPPSFKPLQMPSFNPAK